MAGMPTNAKYAVVLLAGTKTIREIESMKADGRVSMPLAKVPDEVGSTGEGEYECPTAHNEKP